MGDRTRSGSFPSDAAEAFAEVVAEWLEQFESLVDALVTLRLLGDESGACEALLSVPEVRNFRDSWELWELFAKVDSAQLDARLASYLGVARVAWLRFGLRGGGSPATAER